MKKEEKEKTISEDIFTYLVYCRLVHQPLQTPPTHNHSPNIVLCSQRVWIRFPSKHKATFLRQRRKLQRRVLSWISLSY